MKSYLMKIKLDSALCIGSGYSFAGVIDSDICYDEYGLPYIPARRLKGCMREVAEGMLLDLLEHDAEEIFGKAGNSKNVGFSISNAHIDGISGMISQIRSVRSNDDKLSTFVSKQNILEQFTSVKLQTAMTDGVADDNSFRSTRIVNQTNPVTGAPLIFSAEITCEEDMVGDLELIVKGLRNIGVMRNRGLGSVSCHLEAAPEHQNTEVRKTVMSSDLCCIRFVITNTEPLMISAGKDEVSERFIPGQNVLGMMAGRYLSRNGNSAKDEEFKDLFLNGKTIFTNVYPLIENELYYPAPAFVNKLKKTKKLVNIEAVNYSDDPLYSVAEGNQPKKLKGLFLAEKSGRVAVHEVPMKIIYHHNHRMEKLYSHQVINESQMFCGRIIAPVKYADELATMLSMGDVRFGKSKTAQYGQCKINEISISEYEPEQKEFKAGKELLIVMRSDALFTNGSGYTVSFDEVISNLENALGIKAETDGLKSFSIIQTKKIYGYNSKWNLRKQPMIGIEAGSVYAVRLAEDATIKSGFVGERNVEGYGEILVIPADDISYSLGESADQFNYGRHTAIGYELKSLIKNIVLEDIKERTIWKAVSGDDFNKKVTITGISNSLRGRITLMLAESIDKFKGDNQWRDRCADFVKRIDSIDRKPERGKVKRALSKEMFTANCKDIELEYFYPDSIDAEGILKNDLGYSDEEVTEMISCLWSDVLMAILVNDKYMKGDER